MAPLVTIGHFVVMRFGIGIFDERWLEHRIQLFKSTMLPSLRAQTALKYHFAVQIDRQLPRRYRLELESLLSSLPRAEIRELELHLDNKADHYQQIAKACEVNGYRHFISTRVDDDDVMTAGTLSAIQEAATGAVETGVSEAIISVRSGFWYVPAHNLAQARNSNGIGIGLSVVLPAGDQRTIYSFNHSHTQEVAENNGWPLLTLEKETAQWIYTIHKYSDTEYLKKSEMLRRRASGFTPKHGELDVFPIDWQEMGRWLELERAATPLGATRTIAYMAEIERSINALREKARLADTDEERRIVQQEIETLTVRRLEAGSKIVETLGVEVGEDLQGPF